MSHQAVMESLDLKAQELLEQSSEKQENKELMINTQYQALLQLATVSHWIMGTLATS